MAESEKKLPDENSSSRENEDNLRAQKEAAKGIEKNVNSAYVQNELHSLKESFIKKEGAKLLVESDWLGEKEENPKKDTHEMQHDFRSSLGTDHVEHFSDRRADRIIGKNPLQDISDFGVGAVDSLATTGKLVGHLGLDLAKLLVNPLGEYKRTRDILENNIV